MTDAESAARPLCALIGDQSLPDARPATMTPPAQDEAPGGDLASSMSSLEYSLYVIVSGFWRWQSTCAEKAGAKNLATLDIEVLHSVNNRARNRKLHDICLIMNISEPHLVAYSLKKLIEGNFVTYERNGRDRIYCASASGDAFCERYLEIRERFLIEQLRSRGIPAEKLKSTSELLRQLSRIYDDVRRDAAVSEFS